MGYSPSIYLPHPKTLAYDLENYSRWNDKCLVYNIYLACGIFINQDINSSSSDMPVHCWFRTSRTVIDIKQSSSIIETTHTWHFGRCIERVHTTHLFLNLIGLFYKSRPKLHVRQLHSSTVTTCVWLDNGQQTYSNRVQCTISDRTWAWTVSWHSHLTRGVISRRKVFCKSNLGCLNALVYISSVCTVMLIS
jgi:hypothetical protein